MKLLTPMARTRPSSSSRLERPVGCERPLEVLRHGLVQISRSIWETPSFVALFSNACRVSS